MLRSSCSRKALTRDSYRMSDGRSERPIGLTDGLRTSSARSSGSGSMLPQSPRPFQGSTGPPSTTRPNPPTVAHMKSHEYQAKELPATAGANVPRHIVVKTPEEAAAAFDKLSSGGGVVVKAQVHAGGRGAGQLMGYADKLGGVRFCTSR